MAENLPSEPLPQESGNAASQPPVDTGKPRISGWLAFFVFTLFMSGFLSFGHILYSWLADGGLLCSSWFYGVLLVNDLFLALNAVGLSVYTAWSIIGLRPNAPFLVRFYLIYMLAVNLFLFLLFYSPSGSNGLLKDLTQSAVYAAIWITFLARSKQVKRLFPPAKRRLFRRDWAIVGVVTGVSVILFSMMLVETMHTDESEEPLFAPIDLSSLPYGEYSDGYIVFRKPDGWACRQEVNNGSVTFYLTCGDVCRADIISYYDEDFTGDSFAGILDQWNSDAEESDEYPTRLLRNDISTTPLTRIYHYAERCESSPAVVSHCVAVKDLHSPILCLISYGYLETDEDSEKYLQQIIDSVRFR